MPCPMTSTKQVSPGVVLLLAAANASLLVPLSTPAQTPAAPNHLNWTIDITFTAGTGGQPDMVKYNFTSSPPLPTSTVCSEGPVYPSDPKKGDLNTCPGDHVKWIVHTGGKAHLVIFQPDLILGDKNDKATPILDADENNPTAGGKVILAAIKGEYYVTAYDQESGHFFRDDPQIIVGTGSYEVPQLVNEIQKQANQLAQLLPGNRYAKKLLKDSEALKASLAKK